MFSFNQKNIASLTKLTGVFLLAGASLNAHAGTTNNNFQASASVNASCQSLSATNLSFGTYDPTSATDITATSTVSVACTTGTVPSIAFNAGTTTGASTAQRLLANASNTMNYNIYTNNTYAQVLDASHTLSITGTGLGNSVSTTAYGKIPKNQLNVVTGSFTDTITVTVTY
jgi:spore coat protein U-like protein